MPRLLLGPQELSDALASREPPVVVDCRFSLADPEAGRRAYEAGHVPGAVYAHLDHDLSGPVIPKVTGRHPLPDPHAFAARASSWGVTALRRVVAYDDVGGAFAARALWLLRWVGHADVALLHGGYDGWTGAGLDVTASPAEPTRGQLVPRVQPRMVASLAEVQALSESGAVGLLDARGPARYRGDEEPIDARAGHIPGARSLPYTELLHEGRWLPPEAIASRFQAALGELPADRAIASCGSGVTAALLVLAAEHAGLGTPRLYPGSFSEWITDPERPVNTGPDP